MPLISVVLACPVWANDGQDLTSAGVQADIIQGSNPTGIAADVLNGQSFHSDGQGELSSFMEFIRDGADPDGDETARRPAVQRVQYGTSTLEYT